jgi:transcriptional regulator with XRE-family HTH domain
MKVNDYEAYKKSSNKITMNNLKTLRNVRGYSVVKLANLINLSDSTISAYENGLKLPSITSLINLANSLDTSIDYLVDRTDNPMSIRKLTNPNMQSNINELTSNYEALTIINKEKLKAYLKGLLDSQNN